MRRLDGLRIGWALLLTAMAGAASAIALLFAGPPLSPICPGTVGPPPEPETTRRCAAVFEAFLATLSPFERFQYEHRWLAAALIGIAVFLLLLVVAGVVRLIARSRLGAR